MKSLSDYERRESIAIASGQQKIKPVFASRCVTAGHFAVLTSSAKYPGYYKISTEDGIGTKVLLSILLDNFKTVGIDGVAMNVNDAATVGPAEVDTLNIYFACQSRVEEEKMGELMEGIMAGFSETDLSGIIPDAEQPNIGKIETASLDEMLSSPKKGYGYDIGFGITAFVRKYKVPDFKPQAGDVIIGFKSTGLHSNGYTAARHKLLKPSVEPRKEWKPFYKGRYDLDAVVPGTQETLGEALLRPTAIYLRAVAAVAYNIPVRTGVNITGNGFKNFNRVGSDVAYYIYDPFEPQPIHRLLVTEAKYDKTRAVVKTNWGTGFALVVPEEHVAKALALAKMYSPTEVKVIGKVIKGCGNALDDTLLTKTNVDGKLVELVGYYT